MFGGSEGDYWGSHDDKLAADLVSASLEMGLNYFDVAEAYNEGRSEETLGRVLKGRRDEAVIGTKISPRHCSAELVRKHCEASLQRLNTDYIDLYMVHWPIRDLPVDVAFEELGKLRDEGKIKVLGVSNFGPQDLSAACQLVDKIGINQLHYNLFSRAIEKEIIPLCQQHHVGVMCYMALLQGLLTGKYNSLDEVPPNRLRTRHFRGDRPGANHGGPGAEDLVNKALAELNALAKEIGHDLGQVALAWLAHKPGVTCVLAGARDVDQLKHNIEGVSLQLPEEIIQRLDAITDPINETLGPNADYWLSGNESRIR